MISIKNPQEAVNALNSYFYFKHLGADLLTEDQARSRAEYYDSVLRKLLNPPECLTHLEKALHELSMSDKPWDSIIVKFSRVNAEGAKVGNIELYVVRVDTSFILRRITGAEGFA